MTDPLRAFDLRGVYVFRWDRDEPLPPAIESHYNAAEDRYELPTDDLLAAVEAAVGDVVVADPDAFTVEFTSEPPTELLDDALLVERGRPVTRVLLPTPDAVERAVDAGGERVD